MTYCVGVTGGIGSGKSTVCKVFSELGIPVFNSDLAARQLMNEDDALKAHMTGLFGDEVYKDGVLDREFVASRVFADVSLLTQLNAIVHPAVGSAFEAFRNDCVAPYCIKEAAILFETGIYKELDRIILVTASEAIRIDRVVQRDQTSEEEVRARMAKQWSDEQKIPLADEVLANNGSELLVPRVIELHQKILDRVAAND